MKRSQINHIINSAKDFMKKNNFYLPKFAYWSVNDWKNIDSSFEEIVNNKLGWDVTDFGSNDFENTGLTLFTLRNGNVNCIEDKSYAEKIMIVKENQKTPMHYHWYKTEDIINRGGGNLIIKLCNSTKDNKLSKEKFRLSVDGQSIEFNAMDEIILEPGMSITITPKVFHSFWGQDKRGDVLVGEVSKVNDDNTDNYFIDQLPRFSPVIEDEPSEAVLSNEYELILNK